MPITKKKISKKISRKLSLTSDESSKFLDTFLSLLKIHSKKKIVKLNRFGALSYKKTISRPGRNPKTKESYIIKSQFKPVFKPSNKIKEILN